MTAGDTKARSEYARALDRVARHLALRDHSRLELKRKLSRSFPPELVEQALAEAESRGWLAPEEEIAARAALSYQRKLKSRGYIERQLRRRGLPSPPADEAAELDKIRALMERHFGAPAELSFDDRAKAFRFLKYRGFEDRWIRQVLNEKS